MQKSHKTQTREEEYKKLRRQEKMVYKRKNKDWKTNIVCELEQYREF